MEVGANGDHGLIVQRLVEKEQEVDLETAQTRSQNMKETTV